MDQHNLQTRKMVESLNRSRFSKKDSRLLFSRPLLAMLLAALVDLLG
jgi:hypothetical protein